MELTQDFKQKVVQAIAADRPHYPSDSKHAISLGINKSVYSQIRKGILERKMKDCEWVRVARKLNVPTGKRPEWKAANTPVYNYLYKQFDHCKQESTTGIFCDKADIGKTFTAREFARNNGNVVYIDCSEYKTKQRFIRSLSTAFGIDASGKLAEVIADLVYYVKTLDRPLVILDEAGDLEYPAFLELKSLYNMLEDACGWYMLGADGLEAKMTRAINNKKVGYAEIFSRYGAQYQYVVPKDDASASLFFRHQAEVILRVNLPQFPGGDDLLKKCRSSLRRLRKEVVKIKRLP